MLALLKNDLNYLQDSIFECFFKKYNIYFSEKYFFSQLIMMKILSLEEENMIINIINL